MNQNEKDYLSINEMESADVSRTFMSKVFLWMCIALGITALTAFLSASSPAFFYMLINSQTGRMSLLGWVVTLAPLILVFVMSARIDRMSKGTMTAIFVLYSVLMGMSLSFIFLAYSSAVIVKTFLITAGMFGVMAVAGFTTKTDLTKFGKIMFMGLIGLIIATLVNLFTKSAMFDYVISFIGVLIFTGLTAFDVQKLKQIGATNLGENDTVTKIAIWGALSLYLDFINLFLYLLRIFGSRD
ncbi:MAG: Bax inhibitor-1/YccA family protein [bacterium]|nr:Bax inhibitor-1/YccA family protein [Candidatus Limimorpha equi]